MTMVNNISKTFRAITANFSGNVRHDQMGGREYLVAPMVMLVEGVCNGISGPAFYSKEEISKFPSAWNSKPVVVYHPQINGKGVSACTPDIITNHGIGVIMNTRWEDDKLKAEAWFEVERANAVDDRIMKAVENNEVMELSTGLFLEEDRLEEEMTFNDKTYQCIAKNFQPDHLALLPDLKGSCSIADGAGFLRFNSEEGKKELVLDLTTLNTKDSEFILKNVKLLQHKLAAIVQNEMSHENLRSLLNSALQSNSNNEFLWIDSVFDDFFVYEDGGKLWKQDYKIEDEVVTLTGTAVEVVRVVEFRTLDGKFIGNFRKEQFMNKKKLVDGLIANAKTKWEESDREALMSINEDVLKKMDPIVNEDSEPAEPTKPVVEADSKPDSDPVENSELSVDEFLKTKVPTQIAGVLQNAMKMHDNQKEKLVVSLVANDRCTFTEEFLKTKDIEELQNLCSLAGNVEEEPSGPRRFDYSGQGSIVQLRENSVPLSLPVFDEPVKV